MRKLKLKTVMNESELDFKKYLRPNNLIDLGDDNGWNRDKRMLFQNLYSYKTGNTDVKDLNSRGTYKQYSTPIKLNGKKYTVVFKRDSSD